MATHRASYWKTTAISFVAAIFSAAGLIWVLSSGLPPTLVGVFGLLFATGLVVTLLIGASGLVCLWRDARETARKGDPLAGYANRPPPRDLLSRAGLSRLRGPRLRPGDLVQVRPRAEIEATLDRRRTLAGLPFMAEMEVFCGGIFQVHRRVDHINDMRHKTGLRRIHDVVTLSEIRCSGAAHDGCQAECQILWKDAWLRRFPAGTRADVTRPFAPAPAADEAAASETGDRSYFCQMTALWEASEPMSPIDVKQHFRPLLNGNVGLAGFLIALLTRIFNFVQRLRGGAGYPHMPQYASEPQAVVADSHLRAGDRVQVRSKDEIARTLVNGRNKGLWFDRDMIRFCGRPAIVRRRVNRIIHEGTGKMVVLKTPCLALEGVIATGEFLRLCPQHEYIFWREAWLARSPMNDQNVAASD